MHVLPRALIALSGAAMLLPQSASAWGGTAHAVIDRAAIEAILAALQTLGLVAAA